MVDNLDWLGSVSLLDFLRDVGKHFAVNQMIQRDSVKPRFESREEGISYTEFSYMLLQAYDFLELHRRYGCRMQCGRLRPVGQHRVGRRPGPPAGGQDRLRSDHAAADRQRGEEIRQEREGRRLPGSEADVAVRVLPILAEHRRRRRRTLPALADGAAARGDRGVRGGAGRGAHRAARAGRGPHPPRARRRRAGARAARDRGAVRRRRPARHRRRPAREALAAAPSITVARDRFAGEGALLVDLLAEVGACPSKSDARRQLGAGGIAVNGVALGTARPRRR